MSKITGTPEQPHSVHWLAQTMKEYIGRLGSVWVEGEVTQWSLSRGNVFGKLRDAEADATVSFNLWSSTASRLPEEFKQGDRVVALVKPDYWVKGGTLSMVASDLRHVGLGELLARLERLRQQLQGEGLFSPERKRRLPFLPGTIGLITGKDSDAEKDVIRNATLRWPDVRFRVEHAAVQGDRAVPTVLEALAKLDADAEVDVIIIARGGGDFQNLLPFSDESLVRAVAAAATPVVSAIGHEADRPLLDEVADLRASTPTDAAKRVVPDVAEERARIDQARTHLRARLTQFVQREIERIESIRSRPALARPGSILDDLEHDLARLSQRSDELMERTLERGSSDLRQLAANLRALSPQSTLDRGYAVVQSSAGGVVRAASDVSEGDTVLVTLAKGAVDADVTLVHP